MSAGHPSGPGAVTWAGLAVVAGAAAVLSFATVRDLADAAGYPPRLAWLLPVVIDATAVVGSRIWLGAAGAPGAVSYARALALAAAVVTIGANVLQHGLAAHQQVPPWWLVAALAAIPPTALVAVAHQVALLTRPHRSDQQTLVEAPGDLGNREPSPVDACEAANTALPVGEGELAERARQLVSTAERPVGRRRLARELDITEHQARRLLSQVGGAQQRPGDRSDGSPAPTLAFPELQTAGRNGAHHD